MAAAVCELFAPRRAGWRSRARGPRAGCLARARRRHSSGHRTAGRRRRSPRGGRGQFAVRRPSVIDPVDPLEVLEGGEVDLDLAVAGPHRDPDPGLEVVAEQLLELEQARAAAASVAGGAADLRAPARSSRERIASSTSRTDRSSATARLASCSWNARSGVPSSARAWPMRRDAVLHVPLDRRRELQQSQRVRDGRAALARPVSRRRRGSARSPRSAAGRPPLPRAGSAPRAGRSRRSPAGASPRRRRCGRSRGSSGARPAGPRASDARPRSTRSRHHLRRTRTGWSTPTSRIDSASDASDSSSKCSRGCCGFGRIAEIGISCETDRVVRDDTGRDQRAEPSTQPSGSRHGSPPSPVRDTRRLPETSSRTR